MRTKTTMITNKKLGRRPKTKRMSYEEPIGRDRSPTECKKTNTKKNWAEEAKETTRKSSTQGRNVPLKRNNTTMKKNLVKKIFF